MTKKLTLGLSIVALATAAGGVAMAAPGGMRADADNNGTITRAEMDARANEQFTRMDANRDGRIDQTDRAAMRAERQNRMFAMMDKDGNGQVSRAEFDAMHADRAERRADRTEAGKGDRRGKQGWNRGGRGGHGGGMMRMADANRDGAITRAEFDAARASRFQMMDANNDGSITQAERQASREKMRAQWRANRAAATPAT